MNILDVKKDIREKALKPFYIFTGEEIGIMHIYINKMAEVIGTKPTELEHMSDIVSSVSGNSLFKTRKLFVVRDDAEFLKHENVWEQFEKGTIQGDNIVVLVLYSLDKRSKLYKTYESTIVDFKRLNESVLSVYAQRELDLTDDDALDLIYVCESDYSRMMLEIDKIKQYTQSERDTSVSDAFTELLNDGTIYVPPKDAIFDFVDVILRGQINKAFDLLYESYAVGENVLALISVLYTNTKQLLQVQSADANTNLEKATDMTAWQIKCAKQRVGHYKNGDLVYLMRLLQDVERKIKLGEIEDSIAMDYILVNFLM